MLKAVVNSNGAYMEIEVGQEDIAQGDVKVEKVVYMQNSPISLLYFSDKGIPLAAAARLDMQKVMFIDDSPLAIAHGDLNHIKLNNIAFDINQAWLAAAANISPPTKQVEFVTPSGQPFTNFSTPQP